MNCEEEDFIYIAQNCDSYQTILSAEIQYTPLQYIRNKLILAGLCLSLV